MNVGTPPFRIIENYSPYPVGDIHHNIKSISKAIERQTPCTFDEELLRYALKNDELLPKKTLQRLSQLKRIMIQDKVETFWPEVFRIVYPPKRETTAPLTISVDKNSEMSLELDWEDLMGFEQVDSDELSFEETPPLMIHSMSPEEKKMYHSFKAGQVDLSASEKAQMSPAEVEESALLKEQHLFLETLGRAIFATYVSDAIPLITKLMTQTLKDKELLDVLAPHLRSTVLAKIPEGLRSLPVELLRSIISGQISAFEKSLEKIIDDGEQRREIGKWIEELLKESKNGKRDPSQPFVVFLAEQYLPDILHGVLGALRNSIAQKTFDPVIGTLLDILQGKPIENGIDLEAPIAAAEMILEGRLNNSALRDRLMEALHPLLIELFFPDPSNIDELTKNVMTSILFQTEKFFEGLNQASLGWDQVKSSDKTLSREEGALQALAQKLFTDGIVPLEAKDVLEAIVLLMQEIFAKVIFKSAKVADLKPREKCIVILLSKMIHNAIKPFCSIKFINLILVRLYDGTLSIHNPYEKPLPSISDFDGSDKVFSDEIDLRIRTIASQVINLAFTSSIAKKGAKKMLELIPQVGERVQKTLNQIFNSGTTLMPGIFAAQFLFKQMPAKDIVKLARNAEELKRENQFMRQAYVERLKSATPSYDLALMEGLIARSQWIKDDILGKDNSKTKDVLRKFLPFGTQGQALKLIKKIYGYAQHDLFVQILLVFMLRGVSDGIGVPKARK